jgi:hypothetical protein
MKLALRRCVLAAAVAAVGISSTTLIHIRSARAAANLQQEVAAVEKLKSDAFHELRGGHFDKTNDLLNQAATLSHDPQVEQMAEWTKLFEAQHEEFAAERHKQYEKSVQDVKKLQENGKTDSATDAAARAYLLSDDKKVFRAQDWVDALVKEAVQRAEQYDKNEQWIKALRLYSDLAQVEPAQPLWKDELKLATRRVRLLALYTPEVLRKLQEGEVKDRAEIEALLNPTTQPATQPTTKPVESADNDTFKIDWHDTLKGVRMPSRTTTVRSASATWLWAG